MKNKDRETFLLNKIERLEQSLSTVTEAKMTLDSKEKENITGIEKRKMNVRRKLERDQRKERIFSQK